MVSSKQIGKIAGGLALRSLLLIPLLAISLFLQQPFYDFAVGTLQYREPSGFFGFNLYFLGVGFVLSWTFWSGIIYGTIGKKLDYLFIAGICCFSAFNLYLTDNVTILVYEGLLGVALVGNILGYSFKLLRQKVFAR